MNINKYNINNMRKGMQIFNEHKYCTESKKGK